MNERRASDRRKMERRNDEIVPTLEWSEKFSTSVRAIDSDHQTLFEEIATLKHRFEEGAEQDAIGNAIKSLTAYCNEHFEREEQFMEKAHYPGLKEHKKEHKKFKKLVKQLAKINRKEPDTIDGIKVIKFLSNWLSSHILISDMKYIPYMKGEADGKAEQLKISVPKQEVISFDVPAPIAQTLKEFEQILSEGGQIAKALEEVIHQFGKKQDKLLKKSAMKLFCKKA
ncbi:MAG: bacteriohemerythrin [Rhodospirillales bacterium]|nr:bacteriohemerythrin [Rhodospirillales bacterium]